MRKETSRLLSAIGNSLTNLTLIVQEVPVSPNSFRLEDQFPGIHYEGKRKNGEEVFGDFCLGNWLTRRLRSRRHYYQVAEVTAKETEQQLPNISVTVVKRPLYLK